jgi:hypothetical protein
MHNYFDVHSGQWAMESLSGFSDISPPLYKPYIDIASDGRIVIGISANERIQTAIKENGYWTYLPILTGLAASGGFTTDGNPSVAFMDSNSGLNYAVYVNDTIGWAVTPVDYLASQGYPSLAQSSTATPGIAVMTVDGRLTYHTNITSGWTTTLIEENMTAPGPVKLIFDNNDKPLIVYANGINGMDLKLAGTDLTYFSFADLNDDAKVNLSDFAIFAQNWKMTTPPEQEKFPGDLNKDDIVDVTDLQTFTRFWLDGCAL